MQPWPLRSGHQVVQHLYVLIGADFGANKMEISRISAMRSWHWLLVELLYAGNVFRLTFATFDALHCSSNVPAYLLRHICHSPSRQGALLTVVILCDIGAR